MQDNARFTGATDFSDLHHQSKMTTDRFFHLIKVNSRITAGDNCRAYKSCSCYPGNFGAQHQGKNRVITENTCTAFPAAHQADKTKQINQ